MTIPDLTHAELGRTQVVNRHGEIGWLCAYHTGDTLEVFVGVRGCGRHWFNAADWKLAEKNLEHCSTLERIKEIA